MTHSSPFSDYPVLQSIGGSIHISFNPELRQCSIEGLCNILPEHTGFIGIRQNNLGCQSPDDVLDNCTPLRSTTLIDINPELISGWLNNVNDVRELTREDAILIDIVRNAIVADGVTEVLLVSTFNEAGIVDFTVDDIPLEKPWGPETFEVDGLHYGLGILRAPDVFPGTGNSGHSPAAATNRDHCEHCAQRCNGHLRLRSSEELTSLGSGAANDPTPLTTLTIELDLKAAVTAGTLDSRLQQSESRPLGLFKKLRRYVNAFSGSGTFEIDDFPKGDLINAVFFNESANDIDRVRLERDDFVMFDRTKELNSRIQTDGVRAPQADLFVYDTTEKGNGVDQLLTRKPDGTLVNDLRWFMEIDGAMTITSNVEYLGALEL